MELNSATTRILSLVRQETGREIEMVADPSLQVLAKAKMATGKLTAHVIVYNPNKKAVDYSIAYECGFILRLYEGPEEQRLQFASTDAGTNAVRQLVTAPGGIAKRMSLPDPLISQFTGFSSVQNPGFTTDGTRELEELFGEKILGFPKPTKLVSLLLSQGTSVATGDLVVDFFAGSGTTAHALLEMNKQDGGNRKFILLQLPEPTGREDYRTIADIAKERLRRVIRKINEHDTGKLDLDGGRDLGFRVFKLAESNFKPWDADVAHNGKTLDKQLELHVDHIRDGRSADDILYEILLKSGFPLTTQVEALKLEGKTMYSVAEGVLLVCLERELTLGLIRAMAEKKPERVVCLDQGFEGNDQLKTNAVQTFKTKGVTSFKTV